MMQNLCIFSALVSGVVTHDGAEMRIVLLAAPLLVAGV